MIKIMINQDSGRIKKVKVGFSWTTFFFGFIPSAIRGDFISALKIFFLDLITLKIYSVWKAFGVNKDYEVFLESKGYVENEMIKSGIDSIPALEYLAVGITTALPIFIVIITILVQTNIVKSVLSSEIVSRVPIVRTVADKILEKYPSEDKKDNPIVLSENKIEKEEKKKVENNEISNSNKEEKEPDENILSNDIPTDKEEEFIPSFDEGNTNSKNEASEEVETAPQELSMEEFFYYYDNFLASNMVEINHSDFDSSRPIEEFKGEIREIERSIEEIHKKIGKTSYYTSSKASFLASKEFEMYDKEINYIWAYLQQILPKDQMDALTEEELEWIDFRDAAAQRKIEEYGEVMGASKAYLEKARITKARCYYLLDYIH